MLSPMASLSITVQRSHLMDINAQLSSRARVPIPVLIPHRLRFVLYSITKHAMRRSADDIGATSISFRPKVFSDATSVVDCVSISNAASHTPSLLQRVKRTKTEFQLPYRSGISRQGAPV